MEFIYIWFIVAFGVGIIIGGLVSNRAGWRAYFTERKGFKKYKADLRRILDVHAKEGLVMSYSDVENFMRKNR